MSTPTSDHDTLWELIKDIRFGMLTHRHGDGHLHSAPMTTQNKSLDEQQTLYFFVSCTGDVVRHLATDRHVNVAYSHPSDDRYVSVSGEAAVIEDMAKKEELWSVMAKAWFPGGPTDPDLALLAVRITHAEYWNVKESSAVQLFKMAKAAITGKPPEDMGEHKELRM